MEQQPSKGFTIVFRFRPVRHAMGLDRSPGAGIVHKLNATRVFNDRSTLSTNSRADERGTLYVADAGDYQRAASVLEEVESTEGVTRAYIAPDRDVLVERSTFHQSGSTARADSWHNQVRLDDARRLPQWSAATFPVEVAVVDSGVDNSHPQLRQLAFQDHLGIRPPTPDKSGHGSHVAGLIAATFDSGNGFGGLADDCARVTVHRGLTRPHDVAGYYRALRYAASARVINLSTGGEGEDLEESETIAEAIANGCVVVAAMGNHADLGNPDIYPAMLPGVIAVGAVDAAGNRASFSNHGDHIVICAPGVDILSTVPTYPIPDVMPNAAPPLAAFSGTSMATPIVAAAIARMLAIQPTLKSMEVLDLLKGNGSSWNSDVGRGVIDLVETLQQL